MQKAKVKSSHACIDQVKMITIARKRSKLFHHQVESSRGVLTSHCANCITLNVNGLNAAVRRHFGLQQKLCGTIFLEFYF